MSSPIREDLVVPYHHVPAKVRNEASSSMMSQTLPMAAMFMRNKLMSWSAVFLAVQAYLSEPINKPPTADASQPPMLRVLFALIALATCYVEILFPVASPAVKRAAQAAAAASSAASATAEATS